MPRTVKKETIKTEKVIKKVTPVKAPKAGGLSVPSFTLDGKEAGVMELPKEIFGAKINEALMAQAVRVYQNNQKSHFSNTKTRSEVKGSSKKIRAQKGTGGARHGTLRAPIFVGGGIALGPKYRKVTLDLPKKMRRAALLSALSFKAQEGEIFGAIGLEKASGKTKQVSEMLTKIGKKDILFLNTKNENFARAVKNLKTAEALPVDQLSVLETLGHQTLVFSKEALEKLAERLSGKKE